MSTSCEEVVKLCSTLADCKLSDVVNDVYADSYHEDTRERQTDNNVVIIQALLTSNPVPASSSENEAELSAESNAQADTIGNGDSVEGNRDINNNQAGPSSSIRRPTVRVCRTKQLRRRTNLSKRPGNVSNVEGTYIISVTVIN